MPEEETYRTVKSVWDIPDESFMKHMERSHPEDLNMSFTIEPGQSERRIREGDAWRVYHDTLHRMYPNGQTDRHEHLER